MEPRILRIGKNIILWLSILFMGFLTVVSLISTTYFTPETSFPEIPSYRFDNLFWNLLILVLVLGLLVLIQWRFGIERIPTKVLAAVAVLFVLAVSVIWIEISHTYPEADQKFVSYISYLMSEGDFKFFKPGRYMQVYPNQLGLSAILELLYRITGGENWKAFMYLTALSNGAVVYLLYKLTDKLFQNRRINNLLLLLSMGCIQIILYTTFLYGIMLGLALSLAAFYFLLLFLEERTGKQKLFYGILSGIFIGVSILVKNNYSIFLVAMILLLIYKAIEKKKWYPVLLIAGVLLLSSVMSSGLKTFYEARSGFTITDGMPKSLWIAMGMQEGERAEGWYNGFNYDTFTELNCDEEESNRIAKEAIRESLQRFASDPAYALKFYYKKTVSQWNEPTYEALWANQFHSGDFSVVVQSIYEGKLYQVLHEYMNLYQSLMFLAVCFCLLSFRKVWKPEQLFLMLVILGGFFFHTLWEAKSQYIFPYFVIFLPYGAAGISKGLERAEQRLALRKRSKSIEKQ